MPLNLVARDAGNRLGHPRTTAAAQANGPDSEARDRSGHGEAEPA